MSAIKEYYHDLIEAMSTAKDGGCECHPEATGMDSLCPQCLAEYETYLCDNFESLSEVGLVENEWELVKKKLD